MNLTPEQEAEIRSKVNPLYRDQRGTESHERATLLSEIDRLRAEVAELRKDAERYRWLRDSCGYGYGMGSDTPAECGISFGWQQSEPFESNFSIDAAIDAALTKDSSHE